MKILKFGGTSVGSPQSIKKIIAILRNNMGRARSQAVIVSAFSGVTDQLIKIAASAAKNDPMEPLKNYLSSRNCKFLSENDEARRSRINDKDTARSAESFAAKKLQLQQKSVVFQRFPIYKELLHELEERHFNAVRELISLKKQSSVLAQVKITLNELQDVVHGVALVKELSPRILDFIMSFGERLCAYIFSETLLSLHIPCTYLDSRIVVKTDDHFGNAHVNFHQTYDLIKKYFAKHKGLQIITGFIGSTSNEETTTLGRGGSDYSASLFGAALNASTIEIWTDVDGVMTADPRKVDNAFPIKNLTYKEAMEMSYFGAKVIHPPTMQPALEKKIPIVIKNTFNTSAPGTVIANAKSSSHYLIKGISSIHDIAILRIEGSGMVGVPGISMRLFGALAHKNINVIVITQASSEHSICIATEEKFAQIAKQAIEEEFTLEIQAHRIDEVIIEHNLSVVAVVGENMRHQHGISGRLFQALGRNGINIVAIAQGSSELNISIIIHTADESKALQVIHDAFFLSSTRALNVFLLGTGLIGSTFLKQLQQQHKFLKEKNNIDIRIIAVAHSKKMHFDKKGIIPKSWKKVLKASPLSMNLHEFIQRMKQFNLVSSVFIDCTASQEVANIYSEILKLNISIVTPNKKANAGPLRYYRQLRRLAEVHNVKFLYETNAGAGLPVINTLNDLLITGDKILKIEAILSGTLSYLFNNFRGERLLNDVLYEAYKKGYTEPDPRDDLSGLDVARKLLVLGREMGYSLELKDIKVENLLPLPCKKASSVADFFKLLKKHEAVFEEKKRDAERHKKVLRYIATLSNKTASVSLEAIDASHPFYSLSGSDNIISFTTKRYRKTPLVVKGPGAGAEVTAAGVFADLLRISNYLGIY